MINIFTVKYINSFCSAIAELFSAGFLPTGVCECQTIHPESKDEF